MRMKVATVPDLRQEGWRSMDLYASRLWEYLPSYLAGAELTRADAGFGEWSGDRAPDRPGPGRYLDRYVNYPFRVRSERADVYHVLDHSYGHVIDGLDPRRCVVTVHDLFPLQVIEAPARGVREHLRNWLLRRSLRHALRCALIIVNSRFMLDEMKVRTEFPSDRLRLIPLGVDAAFFTPPDPEQISQLRRRLCAEGAENFLLHVGSCDTRKGLETLLRAFVGLGAHDRGELLFVQLGGTFTPAQEALIGELGIARRVRQIPEVSPEMLAAAYHAAVALVSPSSYEGFGLPILEAMAAGTTIVASRLGPTMELLQGDGFLAESGKPDDFAAALTAALQDTSRARAGAARAQARARRYTWDETARRTAEVYRELHDGQRC
ncbi:MAG: glycosyltransferase [Acidobacteria bacterium]|nr:glycosyltransferase [Acidobacteriota bacterium]